MLRWKCREYLSQFLANTNPAGDKEFHDLAQENDRPNKCQIDKIISQGHDKVYESKVAAKVAGYEPCVHCMPGETKL